MEKIFLINRIGLQDGIWILEEYHVEFTDSEGVKGPVALNTLLLQDGEQVDWALGVIL